MHYCSVTAPIPLRYCSLLLRYCSVTAPLLSVFKHYYFTQTSPPLDLKQHPAQAFTINPLNIDRHATADALRLSPGALVDSNGTSEGMRLFVSNLSTSGPCNSPPVLDCTRNPLNIDCHATEHADCYQTHWFTQTGRRGAQFFTAEERLLFLRSYIHTHTCVFL